VESAWGVHYAERGHFMQNPAFPQVRHLEVRHIEIRHRRCINCLLHSELIDSFAFRMQHPARNRR
jgi:hypothetical protein